MTNIQQTYVQHITTAVGGDAGACAINQEWDSHKLASPYATARKQQEEKRSTVKRRPSAWNTSDRAPSPEKGTHLHEGESPQAGPPGSLVPLRGLNARETQPL